MESKRVVILVTLMIVMGNLLIQTEAQQSAFASCYPGCLFSCPLKKGLPQGFLCPFTCIQTCLAPHSQQMLSTNDINDTDYFCKVGCATQHCAPFTSPKYTNVDQVVKCVDSCSDKCTTKN